MTANEREVATTILLYVLDLENRIQRRGRVLPQYEYFSDVVPNGAASEGKPEPSAQPSLLDVFPELPEKKKGAAAPGNAPAAGAPSVSAQGMPAPMGANVPPTSKPSSEKISTVKRFRLAKEEKIQKRILLGQVAALERVAKFIKRVLSE